MFNWNIYAPYYEEAKRVEQERIKDGLRGCKTVIKGCDDFSCCFAGTKLCIQENCDECELHNCRGCNHIEECINEIMEV